MQTDTLTYNAQQIAVWQESGDYDYNRELVGSQMNLLEWIMRKIDDFMEELFSGITSDVKYTLYVIGALLLLFFIIFLVVKLKPKLFRREEKSELDYKEVEDTIYGIDFDSQISDAKNRKDWFEAVRLIYLDTLRFLSDNGKITWQPWKPPMQYTSEMPNDAFRDMTRQFVKVRYGNYEASEENVNDMEEWQRSLKSSLTPAEKGGQHE